MGIAGTRAYTETRGPRSMTGFQGEAPDVRSRTSMEPRVERSVVFQCYNSAHDGSSTRWELVASLDRVGATNPPCATTNSKGRMMRGSALHTR